MLEYAPVFNNYLYHDEAILYCQFLEYNGHRDWRIPTTEEYHYWQMYVDQVRTARCWHTGMLIPWLAYYVLPVRDV
jgi:hypothetical protein